MKKRFGCLLMLLCLALFGPWGLVQPLTTSPAMAGQEHAARVDVNTATAAELQTLPGIGQVTAQRIIEFRSTEGAFTSPEDLLKVKGIGRSTLTRISDRIEVR